jgi:hypothetical protein
MDRGAMIEVNEESGALVGLTIVASGDLGEARIRETAERMLAVVRDGDVDYGR